MFLWLCLLAYVNAQNPPAVTASCPASGAGTYAGQTPYTTATKPYATPLLGNVGCVDQVPLATRPTAQAGPSTVAATNIYGPFEAGFTSAQPGMSCLGSNTLSGGVDTGLADLVMSKYCGTTINVLDSCGGHANPYHYHQHMSCLYSASTVTGAVGHSTRVGTALDGRGIYGKYITGGVLPTDLDGCGGRYGVTPDSNGASVYYYPLKDDPPYTMACYGPGTLAQCKALYTYCTDSSYTYTLSTNYGSGTYQRYCPCFDNATVSNTGAATRPAYLAPTSAPRSAAHPRREALGAQPLALGLLALYLAL